LRILACHAALLVISALAGCRTATPPPVLDGDPPSIRFLLTFDDGPSIRSNPNPTLSIMNQFATNDVQPGIKGIFFVQTGHPRGGGTPKGREIMHRLAAAGQVLAIHSTSPRGHIDHTRVSTNTLVRELTAAKQLLRDIGGTEPLFVRPPFGSMNPVTQRLYSDLGLHVVLADIPARDGVIYGYNGSFRRRIHIRHCLEDLRAAVSPSPTGEPMTVIIGFHDVNPYTARHMTEYLHILVDEARKAGFRLPAKPFYDDPRDITEAALCRRVPPPPRTHLSPLGDRPTPQANLAPAPPGG